MLFLFHQPIKDTAIRTKLSKEIDSITILINFHRCITKQKGNIPFVKYKLTLSYSPEVHPVRVLFFLANTTITIVKGKLFSKIEHGCIFVLGVSRNHIYLKLQVQYILV